MNIGEISKIKRWEIIIVDFFFYLVGVWEEKERYWF